MDGALDFRLLGPLEVLAGARPVPVDGTRQRVVLAMLLLEHGRVVPVDRLIQAVWGESPPSTARAQVQICVSALRRSFADVGRPGLIATRPSGYQICGADSLVDLARFRQLVLQGRSSVRAGDPEAAVQLLRVALSLWRGPALADVDSHLVQTFATGLAEERFTVHEECIVLELALGRHAAVVGELSELVVTYPLRETLLAHLMLALHRAGRTGEALAAFRRAQEMQIEELGLDPSAELRDLERKILRNDPALSRAERPSPGPGSERRTSLPQQLPAAIPDFVGRIDSAQEIAAYLTPGGCGRRRGHVEVVVVGGRSGVGKSALAVQVAHTVREHFPGGQLYAQLRGSEAQHGPPARLLGRFLRALGIAQADLPDDPEDLAALYRSELSDRRVLIVLDDATGSDQLLPFVPGSPGSALLITSRHPLPELHGVHRVELDVFSPSTSLDLLSELVGHDRVRAEPRAADALAEVCDHLPLALRIAGAKLSARRHWDIQQMVDRLTDEGRRLDELTLGDAGVRASIALSFDGLGERAQRLLLLMGMLGPTDWAQWVAAPLLDCDVAGSDAALDELVQARLVEVQSDIQMRHQLHDLVRIFAVERLAREIPSPQRDAAQLRLLCCWLFVVCEAHRHEFGGDLSVLHAGTPRWPVPSGVVERLMADPLDWFHCEQHNIVAAIRSAAAAEHDDLCWELALTAADLFDSLGHLKEWRQTNEVALTAVRRAGNERGEAAMLYSRSGPARSEGRLDDARRDLNRALAWFDAAGDVLGRAQVLNDLADLEQLAGRDDLALTRLHSALSDFRKLGDQPAEVGALNVMAKIWINRGAYAEAEAVLRQALDICPPRARRVRSQVTYWLGETYLARGELAKAETSFQRVLGVVSELNDPIGKACAHLGLGRVRAARRELGPAQDAFQAAVDTCDEIGERVLKSRALLALVELALDRDDPDYAADRLAAYDATLADIGAADSAPRVAEVRERLAHRSSAKGAAQA